MCEYTQTFKQYQTPFFWYDMDLLEKTLKLVTAEANLYGFKVHYALKANFNEPVLKTIQSYGLGADCVSGNEIKAAIKAGFSPEDIVFAGVGKSDAEIQTGLDNNIFAFNVESLEELEVINSLAAKKNKKARIALRLNPNIDPKTHAYITTGLEENKFGVNLSDLDALFRILPGLANIDFQGIHFHIGSQITDMRVFQSLCDKINSIQQIFEKHKLTIKHINVGGGLGIDYDTPLSDPVPDFKKYFQVFSEHLQLKPGQQVHFELGRSIVGQSGNLVSKVLYVKKGNTKNFAIIDAGMTELLRPALYNAKHEIMNITSTALETAVYDVVGPICESADVFRENVKLPLTKRGDLLVIKSVGAYGQVMNSQYNLRDKAKAYYSK